MFKGQTVDIIKMYIRCSDEGDRKGVPLQMHHVCENMPVTVYAYPYLYRHSNEGY